MHIQLALGTGLVLGLMFPACGAEPPPPKPPTNPVRQQRVCGDYTSRHIFGLRQENGTLQVVRRIGTSPQGIASFAEDERGILYIVGYEGMVYRLDFANAVFEPAAPSTSATVR